MTSILKDSGTTFDNVEVENLTVNSNILLGDDDFIQFGEDTDLKMGHDPEITYLEHSKQLQFLSTMTSGDTLKFRETGRRNIIFTFASAKDDDVERSNCYFDLGNETYDGVANVPYMKLRVRAQDNVSSIVNPIELYQPGQNTASSKILLNSNTFFPDNVSAYFGDNNDLRILHNAADSFVQDNGTGKLFLRTNGTEVVISDTGGATNYMGRFIKDGAVELYHNKSKKFETTATGITITGEMLSINDTIVAPSAYMDDPVVNSTISKIDGILITTIFINFAPATGSGIRAASAAANAIISKDDASPGASAITQITSAKNGTIFKVEMHCIETPNSLTDVDLVHAATALSGGTTSGQTILLNTAGLAIGKSYENLSPGDLTNKFLHLSNGSGSSNTSEQTAGKIIIKLYGSTFD